MYRSAPATARRRRTIGGMSGNKALHDVRTAARLSQRALAVRVQEAGKRIGMTNGVNASTINRLEAGGTPQPHILAALEEALGMTAEQLGFGYAPAAVPLAPPPAFPATVLAGIWVTTYEFPRGGKPHYHADIATITATSDQDLSISNTIAARTEGRDVRPFRNEIRAQLASRHLVGAWRNTSDARYFGMIHLAVLVGETVMDGFYTGYDDDETVSTARWRWARLDLPAEVTEVTLLDPGMVYKTIMAHSQYDAPLKLADIGEEAS